MSFLILINVKILHHGIALIMTRISVVYHCASRSPAIISVVLFPILYYTIEKCSSTDTKIGSLINKLLTCANITSYRGNAFEVNCIVYDVQRNPVAYTVRHSVCLGQEY